MTDEHGPREQLIEWLAELGPRWGFPADACRIHGYLYLIDRAATVVELADVLDIPATSVDAGIAWLGETGLARQIAPGSWRTDSDPWHLLTTALAYRRAQELEPARALLASAAEHSKHDPVLARQVARLRDLVEDIAAIDAGSRHLSPATLRRLAGVGAHVSRLFGAGRGRT